MKNEFLRLMELAQIDSQIDELNNLKESIPQNISDLNSQISQLTSRLHLEKEAFIGQNNHRQEVERKLEELKDSISKREIQVKDIKTNKEYHAVQKEISSNKKTIIDLEKELDFIKKTIEELEPKVKDLEANFESKVAEVNATIAEQEKTLQDLDQQVAEKAKTRSVVEQNLNAPTLVRYKALKNKLSPAVAKAEDGICQECNTRIPPQLFIQLQRMEQLQNCPRCQRILFIHVEE